MGRFLNFVRRTCWRIVRIALLPCVVIGGLTAGSLPSFAAFLGVGFVGGAISKLYPPLVDPEGMLGVIITAMLLVIVVAAFFYGWRGMREWVTNWWNSSFWWDRV